MTNTMQFNQLLPQDAIAEVLDSSAFNARFAECWKHMRVRFFKFERIQSYSEPSNPSCQAYLRGDVEKADALLPGVISADAPFFVSASVRSIPIIRLRAVKLPLSQYLQWEFRSYRMSARFGERILLCDLANSDVRKALGSVTDFLLFDESIVLVHNYDANGLQHGGVLVSDPKYIRSFVEFAERTIPLATPFGVFEHTHGLM